MMMGYSDKEVIAIIGFSIEGLILKPGIIIQWSDSKIENNSNIEDYVLEISLTPPNDINKIIHILKKNDLISLDRRLYNTLCGLTGHLFNINKVTLEQACYLIDKLSLEAYNKTGADLFDLGLDDSYNLAKQGIYGNLESVKKRFLQLCKPHLKLGESFYNSFIAYLST